MTVALKMINANAYKIDGFLVHRYSPEWNHAETRINEAYKKAKDKDHFKRLMITRLKVMTSKEKIYYAIAVLYEKGESELVDIYDARLVADILTDL